jgi:hypothetical protein
MNSEDKKMPVKVPRDQNQSRVSNLLQGRCQQSKSERTGSFMVAPANHNIPIRPKDIFSSN